MLNPVDCGVGGVDCKFCVWVENKRLVMEEGDTDSLCHNTINSSRQVPDYRVRVATISVAVCAPTW